MQWLLVPFIALAEVLRGGGILPKRWYTNGDMLWPLMVAAGAWLLSGQVITALGIAAGAWAAQAPGYGVYSGALVNKSPNPAAQYFWGSDGTWHTRPKVENPVIDFLIQGADNDRFLYGGLGMFWRGIYGGLIFCTVLLPFSLAADLLRIPLDFSFIWGFAAFAFMGPAYILGALVDTRHGWLAGHVIHGLAIGACFKLGLL